MAKWGYCLQKLIGMIFGKVTVMEIMLSQDRYTVMEYVSQQTEKFRFAELYYLLKKLDPDTNAEDVKITLEWLVDMDLVKRIFVKVSHGQKWLYYRPRYDYGFLLSRIRLDSESQYAGAVKYRCYGLAEEIRYQYAGIKEKINHINVYPPYNFPFVMAETEYVVPMSQKQRELLRKKIDELE